MVVDKFGHSNSNTAISLTDYYSKKLVGSIYVHTQIL